MSTELAAPIQPEQRLHLLDAIRGFALLGILLMNIEFFNRDFRDFMSGADTTPGAAGIAAWFVFVFVQGKFWVLFSLLFGIGFALMQQRLQASGQPFARLYFRRTVALAGFGLLHILLLWPGDILFAYALTALLLMAFLQIKGKALLITGLGLYFAVALLWVFLGWAMGYMSEADIAELGADMAADVATGLEASRIYAEGSFMAVTAQRAQDYFGVMMLDVLMFQVPMALGVFLIGAWMLGSGRISRPQEFRRFWWWTLVLGAATGAFFIHASLALGSSFDIRSEFPAALHAAGLMNLGNLPLSLAYLAAFVLLFQTGLGRTALGVLAPAGRMALTNYLLQSLICSLLFFGYGFGLYGEVDRWQQVQIAVLIFAAQVAVSPLWLRHFRYGPMEWLWRGITYGRLPALRRND